MNDRIAKEGFVYVGKAKQKPPDDTFIVGNKLMARCQTCGKIIRLDKPIFGSLHICTKR